MNLYDAYMTARDRASAPVVEETVAVFSPAPSVAPRTQPAPQPQRPQPQRPQPAPQPQRPQPPRPPMSEPEGCGCDGGMGNACGGGACRCMPSLAMVYAKPQRFHEMYEAAEGHARGTIFRELDMPFTGGGRR